MKKINLPIYPLAEQLDVGQSHVMQYARETDSAKFDAYLSLLSDGGFTKVFENECRDNRFLTLASDNAYVHAYFRADTKTARIISCGKETSLPAFSPECDVDLGFKSTVTQPVLDYYYYDENAPSSRKDGNYGACYIVTLDDGSLLVYDGGGKWGKDDDGRIWNLIKKLGRKNEYGKTVISAWIITHEHVDHFWCMHEVLLKHSDEITLKSIMCTPIPHELTKISSSKGDPYIEEPEFRNALHNALGSFDTVRLHTGQIFWVRNVKIEVLATPEDIFPEYANDYCDYNDTSTVTRLTVNSRTLTVLGDAYHVTSSNLVNIWGDFLKSDYCTLAHHGWGGGTRELYDLISPSTVLVPFSRKWIDRILNEETYVSSTGETKLHIQWAINRYGDFHKITQHVFKNIACSDFSRFVIADGVNKTLDVTSGKISDEPDFSYQIGYPYH